jgi:hypothetical protein
MMAKTPVAQVLRAAPVAAAPRTPAATFDIPDGLRTSDLGLDNNRTINAWAHDRVLGFLGAHSVEIIKGVAVSDSGKYAEMVRQGDKLLIYGKL